MPTAKFQGNGHGAPYRSWCKTRLANSIDDYNSGKYTWEDIAKENHWSSASNACTGVRAAIKAHLRQSSEEVRERIERSYALLHEKFLVQLMKGGVKPEVAAQTLMKINEQWAKLTGLNEEKPITVNLTTLEDPDDKG